MGDAASNIVAAPWGRRLAKTHEYQLIQDTAPEIEGSLAAQAADGWRPILMSTATVNTDQVRVFIVLEKAIPSPYLK
jgi:hypothetical protein